jgi:hypothetical protein
MADAKAAAGGEGGGGEGGGGEGGGGEGDEGEGEGEARELTKAERDKLRKKANAKKNKALAKERGEDEGGAKDDKKGKPNSAMAAKLRAEQVALFLPVTLPPTLTLTLTPTPTPYRSGAPSRRSSSSPSTR